MSRPRRRALRGHRRSNRAAADPDVAAESFRRCSRRVAALPEDDHEVLPTAVPTTASAPASSRSSEDFYQVLRARIARWLEGKGKGFKHAQLILIAPDLFHLLTRLMLDSRIPALEKARLGAVVVYFVTPVDLMPEAMLGPAGYADDVALAAFALSRLINSGHGAVARELWAGDGDLLELLQQILEAADEMVGKGLWTKLKGFWHGLG